MRIPYENERRRPPAHFRRRFPPLRRRTLPLRYPRSLLSQYRGPSSFQFKDTPMEPDASMRLMPADFAGRKHIRVRFRTDLVCASEANRVMHSVEWGFEYQLDANGNPHVFLINNN